MKSFQCHSVMQGSAETLFGILSRLLRTTLATLNASLFTSSTATSSQSQLFAFASSSLPRSISFFIRVFSNIVEKVIVFFCFLDFSSSVADLDLLLPLLLHCLVSLLIQTIPPTQLFPFFI